MTDIFWLRLVKGLRYYCGLGQYRRPEAQDRQEKIKQVEAEKVAGIPPRKNDNGPVFCGKSEEVKRLVDLLARPETVSKVVFTLDVGELAAVEVHRFATGSDVDAVWKLIEQYNLVPNETLQRLNAESEELAAWKRKMDSGELILRRQVLEEWDRTNTGKMPDEQKGASDGPHEQQ